MQPELKEFKNNVLEKIKKQPLGKSKEYFGTPVGVLVDNEIIGLEFPQVIQFMELKNWIKKIDGVWCVVKTAFGADPKYLEFIDLNKRLIASESKIAELKEDVDNSRETQEIPLN